MFSSARKSLPTCLITTLSCIITKCGDKALKSEKDRKAWDLFNSTLILISSAHTFAKKI
jgi:hypothetical protein